MAAHRQLGGGGPTVLVDGLHVGGRDDLGGNLVGHGDRYDVDVCFVIQNPAFEIGRLALATQNERRQLVGVLHQLLRAVAAAQHPLLAQRRRWQGPWPAAAAAAARSPAGR